MMTFKEYCERRLDEKESPHLPTRSNVAYELGVMKSTGAMAGSQIEGKSDIVSRLRPIVMKAFRDLGKKDMHPQEIEEMLLDSLRISILFTTEEGKITGGAKMKMPTSEFIRRSQKKHAGYAPLDEPEGGEPDIDDIE